jgi:integrase
MVAHMVELGAFPRAVGRWRRVPTPVPGAQAFLLTRYWQPEAWYRVLHDTLAADMAWPVGCTGRVNPHRLRHSFAKEMVRLGVSLPAFMRMMGHSDIRMTLRWVEVVQLDLQREFSPCSAKHCLPLPHPPTATSI